MYSIKREQAKYESAEDTKTNVHFRNEKTSLSTERNI
jgi:hypothetical protein